MDRQLKSKIGQMFIAGFPSPEVDDQARELVKNYYVGNFVFFGRNLPCAEQACSLCGELSRLVYAQTGLAPLLAVDQEGGAVSRIREGAALFPGSMALAASRTENVYQVGKNCAAVLHAIGINTNFAPVLDVNLEAQNPIIGARAFSDDPRRVSQLGIGMMTGLKDGGMISAVKHYPGHGNVKSDSHLGVPRNETPSGRLEKTEWLPFQNAFRAGAEALMTAHVCYTDVDDAFPATLSAKVMTELLRRRQHFRGLAITDCLEMDAVRKTYGIGEGAVLAVEAGCDLLTFSHTYEAVEEAALALYSAVESGRLSKERIEASYQRILSLKQKYHLIQPRKIDSDEAQRLVRDADMMNLYARISADSITLLSDSGGVQKFFSANRLKFFAPASLALTGVEDAKPEPLCLSAEAAKRFGGQGIVTPLNEPDPKTLQAIQKEDYDMAVLGLYNARFRKGQIDILRRLEKQDKPLLVVLLGAPYDYSCIRRADAVVAAYEYTTLSVNAVFKALCSNRFVGESPVRLP